MKKGPQFIEKLNSLIFQTVKEGIPLTFAMAAVPYIATIFRLTELPENERLFIKEQVLARWDINYEYLRLEPLCSRAPG